MNSDADQLLLQQAQELARTCPTWADLSNALFDPIRGVVSRSFPTRAERERFVKTPEYKKIRMLIEAAQNDSGLVVGATPRYTA